MEEILHKEQSADIEEIDTEDAYSFKLDQFEGPLDLLLHLIKQAKIDIRDIFISKITEQFLEYMKDIDNLDIDKASDFIETAALLLEIKSKQLLPKSVEEDPDESQEEKLIRKLEEYKLFKEASEKLKVIEDVDKFFKEPEAAAGDYRYILKDLSFEGMLDAFTALMHKVSARAAVPEPKKIAKERFTVAQKISQIKDELLIRKELKFTELFDNDYSKSEIINTFLAVLELLKVQFIRAKQEKLFDEIVIFVNEEITTNE